jgi:pimeloyl-ACP methyl ester carboxylesterase
LARRVFASSTVENQHMSTHPATPFVRKRIVTRDLSLSVSEFVGDGPDLFLLHGIGSRDVSWWPVVDDLAPHFRLIALDWRGHGGSDKPGAGYSLEDYAQDLDGLFAAYGASRPMMIGHSMGGMVALTWAQSHPYQADRVVIEDSPMRTAANLDDLHRDWIALASSTVEEAANIYAQRYPHWSEEERLRRAESITSTALPVFEEMRTRSIRDAGIDRVELSAGIVSPVLLVHGDVGSGGMLPQQDADRFATAVANATVVRIPGGSHSLHRDHAAEFLAAVLPFLGVE